MSIYKKIGLFSILVLISNLSYSQANEIKIRFIGNCGLHLTDGNSNLYVDFPYKSGSFGYMKYDKAELDSLKENAIFLFTHRHPDHYYRKIMKGIKRKRKNKVFGCWNTNKLEILNNSINDFKIEAIKTKHRFAIRHYSYVITWHGKRFFFSGDTETADTALAVKNIDWAFVPSWIMVDANERNLKLDAVKVGIYHLYPTQTINNLNPDKLHILEKQGEVIHIQY